MKCPVCAGELVAGVQKRYETLCEHVFEPVGDLPEKPTLVCQNPLCLTFGRGFWGTLDFEGAFYAERSDGIVACNIRGLPGNLDEEKEKKENKVPYLELTYTAKKALELVGKLPLHSKKTFEFLKKLLEAATCKECGGEGYLDEMDEYDEMRKICSKCDGDGLDI